MFTTLGLTEGAGQGSALMEEAFPLLTWLKMLLWSKVGKSTYDNLADPLVKEPSEIRPNFITREGDFSDGVSVLL